jgi:hypothetical protein
MAKIALIVGSVRHDRQGIKVAPSSLDGTKTQRSQSYSIFY